jgi:hypothetical protein
MACGRWIYFSNRIGPKLWNETNSIWEFRTVFRAPTIHQGWSALQFTLCQRSSPVMTTERKTPTKEECEDVASRINDPRRLNPAAGLVPATLA